MIGLELLFVLTVVSFVLLSMTPFHYQLAGASLTPLTIQFDSSNVTNGPTSSSVNATFPLLPNSSPQPSTNPSLSATNLTQKQELISSHIQRHQPGNMQPLPSQQVPLSQQQQLQQQQLPNQLQPQPQPPMQQQQGILPEGMRPILLDNIKQSPIVLSTLDLEEKLTLILQTYNYCGNPPGGVLPGQDGDKCRQFLSVLDQTLINMLSLQ
jgi:hypothetical protein